MRVRFLKKGARRYGVEVERERAPDLWCGSIGYDDHLPHDLLHFVAEAEFGLDGGVFGDLAAGGNARVFIPVDPALVPKLWRKQRKKGTRLPDGRRSEEVADALYAAWRSRRSDDPAVERLIPLLDDLAARWHGLAVGESITLDWPRPERPRVKAAAAPGTRGARRASAGGAGRRAARS